MTTFSLRNKSVVNKIFFLALIFLIINSIYKRHAYSGETRYKIYYKTDEKCDFDLQRHHLVVEKFYEKRKHWRTSNLGSILFKNIDNELFKHNGRQNKIFEVLVWRYYDWMSERHIEGFNVTSRGFDPLEDCSVKNCIFVGTDSSLDTADAVLVYMRKGVYPNVKNKRNLNQKWIFFSDKSPVLTFTRKKKNRPSLSKLSNIFNWTMTYRSDSDIPVPYGRTISRGVPLISDMGEDRHVPQLIPNWTDKQLNVLAVVLMSNCKVKNRMKFLKELQKYLEVDVIGRCSEKNKNVCPGHYKSDCKLVSTYIFYLALENSMCRQYLTEKVFFHAYSKGAIPVIMGPPVEDCEKLLPPNSYIHIDNYKTTLALAADMIEISQSSKRIFYYHRWRNNFKIINEHGYFGEKSFHYCRVCEALNYNDGEVTIYKEDDLRLFFDENIICTAVNDLV